MYPKYEFERSRDFQKISVGLKYKGTCSIRRGCLSLQSKRVPQALQVANLFDTERLNFFAGAGVFLFRSFAPSKE